MCAKSVEAAEYRFNWQNLMLFLITIGVLVICGLMLRPFLPALTGAIVLAVVTRSFHDWIERRVKNATLAASCSLIVVTLGIIGPLSWVGWNIGRHTLEFARVVQDGSAKNGFEQLINHSPRISAAVEYFAQHFDLNQTVEKGAAFVASKITAILNSSVTGMTQVIFMLFVLFFLYRDKTAATNFFRSLLPMTDDEIDLLLSRINDTVRATVLGRFAVASIQGLVAGISFAGLGVTGASLLGIATALFALIPSFGAFVIWVPVAIYLAVTHHWIKAIILTGIGSLVISTLDNFLYPVLVGTRLQMHTVPIFFSILGGIWLFGVSGLVLGPIVFAVAQSLLLIWRQRAAAEYPRTATSSLP
jgi:predicted PurR-regulated permease PerM